MNELELSQDLIRQESPSGRESPATAVLLEAFKHLVFDEAYIDKAGNALGIFRRGNGPTVMLNGHLDTVPLGDANLWAYPALSGQVANGELWGRGSVDMKSAVACMALAATDAIEAGFNGTLMVTGVVQEEVGGLGARYLAETHTPDVVILGEPSNLNLMLGHRGRIEITAVLEGKIAHAAKNELGVNALYKASSLLQKLEGLELPKGGPLKGSSLTPTSLTSYPKHGANVVPGRAELTIDYRNIPGDEPEQVLERLRIAAPEATFEIKPHKLVSENGNVTDDYLRIAPYYIAAGENSFIQKVRPVLKSTLSGYALPLQERMWWFATDAPYLAAHGAPVIGFGPGLEDLAHTTDERVSVKQLEIARKVYSDLCLALAT
jgi:succinyl-diaminopimelate desuccinylase